MNRGLRTWLVFGACMALGLAGLVWISRMVIGLERRENLARSQAAQEERIRLALWRMDSSLAPLVAQESSRPYFHFRALYPANAAYARMYDRPGPGAVMVPSPLLSGGTPQVRLHFQVDPGGRFSSPQVPDGLPARYVLPERLTESRNRLEELASVLSREKLIALISAPSEEPKRAQVPAPPPPSRASRDARTAPQLPHASAATGIQTPGVVHQAEEKAKELEAKGQVEAARTVSEFAARARQQAASNEMAIQQNLPVQALSGEPRKLAKALPPKAETAADSQRAAPGALAAGAPAVPPAGAQPAAAAKAESTGPAAGTRRDEQRPGTPAPTKSAEATVEVVASTGSTQAGPATAPSAVAPIPPRQTVPSVPAVDIQETPFRPYWAGDYLLLARRVTMPEGEYLQGCWLDWKVIRESLKKAVADLVPGSELLPAPPGALDEPGRLLAALPVRLQAPPLPPPNSAGASPAMLALVIGWACALVSGIAAALLLQQALELGDRRGAFVSAVTHELRTPLTTFRMYAELLHLGMVEDESERRALLETLVVESDRLDHLVKNVLSFARLESGRGAASLQAVPVTELLERGCERLSQRAAQAGMRVEIQIPDDLSETVSQTDPSVVEQILFNLVDNACKYAASGNERRIQIGAFRAKATLVLRVRDFGPGIARADRRKLFRPFHKSAREAARSAPGVGLGLALCRRLAISLGGDLRLEEIEQPGACFLLELPLAPARESVAEGSRLRSGNPRVHP